MFKFLMKPLLIVLLGFVLFSPAFAQKSDQEHSLSIKKRHLLQKALDAYRIRYHIPGISLSIILPNSDHVVTFSSGVKNIKSQSPVTPDTVFQMCSITKVYTAILIHQLIFGGKLSLSQTVGHWLPQYKNWKSVTIKQLLDMHSGIPSYTKDDQFNKAWQSNPTQAWHASEVLAYVKNKPLLYKPGTNWNYSDSNYILLGMILEKITAKTYSQLLQEKIINPLRLKQTFYMSRAYTKLDLNKMATGYSQDNKDIMNVNMSQAGPAGAIVATTKDAAVFFNAIFNGKLLPRQELTKMLVPYSIKSGKKARADSKHLEAWAVGIDQFWMPNVGLTWNKAGGFVGFFTQACYSLKSHVTVTLAANKWVPKAFYNSTRKFIPVIYKIIDRKNS